MKDLLSVLTVILIVVAVLALGIVLLATRISHGGGIVVIAAVLLAAKVDPLQDEANLIDANLEIA